MIDTLIEYLVWIAIAIGSIFIILTVVAIIIGVILIMRNDEPE